MADTVITTNSAVARKSWSESLSFMVGREPTSLTALTGPMPEEDEVTRKTTKRQTSQFMPVVRVDDLRKTRGDKVQIDCGQIVKLVAIMGDENAEGRGPGIDYSTQELKLDMATLPISAGGTMSQQRTVHDLRKNCMYQLVEGMPRFRWQRALVHLAGARGKSDGVDWILPPDLTTGPDPRLAPLMVNTVKAPTYNRHYVVSAGTLVQGGAQLASILSTDVMRLSVIDELAAIWSEMGIRMRPIRIPGDPAAEDAPIKGVLYMDNLVWDNFITDPTAANNIRKWEADAIRRAEYGSLKQHPLFSGATILWQDILIRKMNFPIRFDGGDAVAHITSANRYAGTETNVTVASIGSSYQVSRSLFLGAQALGLISGANRSSEETYTLLEKHTDNFGRHSEFAGELMGAEGKLRWSFPSNISATNELEPTDYGVLVIDSVVRKRAA